MFFHWSLFLIMFLYWLENIIIGLFHVLKLSMVKGQTDKNYVYPFSGGRRSVNQIFRILGKIFRVLYIIVFAFYFGIFTFVHGMFVFAIFKDPTNYISNMGYHLSTFTSGIGLPDGIIVTLLILLLSHGVSFYTNFIRKEEYKKVDFQEMMTEPLGRISVMHITIMAAGFIIGVFGYSVFTASILVIIKTLIDLFTHNKEHIKIMNRGNNLNIIN
jgi:hypothetical protein